MFETYKINKDNTARFTLGRYVSKSLLVFGINPSTATKEKNDTTISIFEHISAIRKCDGYIMLNIYPLRATKIDNNFDKSCNKKLSDENLKYIADSIPMSAEIVAAWGTNIVTRDYFIEILRQINEIVSNKKGKWVYLSLTKSGHPHHPTRLAYDKMIFAPFDIETYFTKFQK